MRRYIPVFVLFGLGWLFLSFPMIAAVLLSGFVFMLGFAYLSFLWPTGRRSQEVHYAETSPDGFKTFTTTVVKRYF